ncbi:MAG: protoporphyrinogen oxidase [Armatimonadetes bacterium]|nr:protoporphyrinogen oxidase [Armatimonadota bacterium]
MRGHASLPLTLHRWPSGSERQIKMEDHRILVLYGTSQGQTRKIAQHVKAYLAERGLAADIYSTNELPPALDVDTYQAYVLADPVYMHKHQKELVAIAKQHASHLNTVPTAFLSVSLTAAHSDPTSRATVQKCIDEFVEETGWKPTMVAPVAGALSYTKYGFFMRMIMKRIAAKEGNSTDTSRDHELTDWQALDRFLADFVQQLPTPKQGKPELSVGQV